MLIVLPAQIVFVTVSILLTNGFLLSITTVSFVAGQEAKPVCVHTNWYTLPGTKPVMFVAFDVGVAIVALPAICVQMPVVPGTTVDERLADDCAQRSWFGPAFALAVAGFTVTR